MAQQYRGRVTTWKDDKGYGFIKPSDGGKEIFFHISSLTDRRTRPAANASVTYSLAQDAQRGQRADNVRIDSGGRLSTALTLALATVLIFAVALAVVTLRGAVPPLVPAAYLLMSGLTFATYALDKHSAVQGERRVPEASMHLLELLGGWPGALIAQQHYRHKSQKRPYQIVYWCIVVANLGALVLYVTVARGAALL